MCQTITIKRTGYEIETPWQFEKQFKRLPLLDDEYYKTLNKDSCLCQCDLEATFKEMNQPYIRRTLVDYEIW